ncbi:hypothetical protein ARALYDRAFT_891296 [Arabidopsis lyrata subsp. lyrata]|uniref:RNase H type-1 domain-containing protein n=1 Tax=Arabidopsis lyrata subsp. lyrata TaxID=81972 RepID=D7KMT6_ARALL|nr:hypothetical protein ARALYDRAFT_891296 [Arabidopsis lyrata subsp. lyrata]
MLHPHFMAEGLAVRAAITAALAADVSYILIESDCQELVKAINARVLLSEIHDIISNILISSKSFELFVCRFISRKANVVCML